MQLTVIPNSSPPSESQILIAKKLKEKLPFGCKRILLVEPPNVPEEDWDPEVASNNRYPVYPPYGLGVISSCLGLRDYITDIIDLNFMIQDNFKADSLNFKFSEWKEWLKDKMIGFQPDVVGVTCMFTIYHRSMVRIAKFVKEYDSNIVIIAGGVHSTMASTDMKSSPGQLVLEDTQDIDFVGLYEGNDSFSDFLDVANGKIGPENLTQIATFINGGYIAVTQRTEPRFETLNAAPNYHEIPIERYSSIGRIGTYYPLWKPDTKAATILFNRGCRAHCRFCSVEKFNGYGVVLRRDKNRVIEELKQLRDRGINYFMALDDDLLNGPVILDIFNEMARLNLGFNWDASNGIIASALTEELADAAERSGCSGLSFGIESGNPIVLKNIPKPSGVHHYIRAGEIMKKHPRIFSKGLLMVGFPPEPERDFPGESIRMIWDTINLAKQMDLDWYTVSPLNLIPGVEITNHAVVRGEISKQNLIDGTERPIVNSTGKQALRSRHEKERALPFIDPLVGDQDRVPTREELIDIWFSMDYRINYEKMWHLENPIKIDMLHKFFISFCDRTHKENALGNLYFALLEYKRGNIGQANYRLNLAIEHCLGNDYWRKRFPAMGLDKIAEDLRQMINGA